MSLLEKARQALNIERAEAETSRQQELAAKESVKQAIHTRFSSEVYPQLDTLQKEFVLKHVPEDLKKFINKDIVPLLAKSENERKSWSSKNERRFPINKKIRFFYPSFSTPEREEWDIKTKELVNKLWESNDTKEKPTHCTIDFIEGLSIGDPLISLKLQNDSTIKIYGRSDSVRGHFDCHSERWKKDFALRILNIINSKSYIWRYSGSNDDDWCPGDASMGPDQ